MLRRQYHGYRKFAFNCSQLCSEMCMVVVLSIVCNARAVLSRLKIATGRKNPRTRGHPTRWAQIRAWICARGHGHGHGHRLLPVVGDGSGCGHEIFLAGVGVRSHYPLQILPVAIFSWYWATFQPVRCHPTTQPWATPESTKMLRLWDVVPGPRGHYAVLGGCGPHAHTSLHYRIPTK